MKNRLAIVVGCTFLVAYTAYAYAQEKRTIPTVCDKTETVISTLKNKYSEIPIMAGVSADPSKSIVSIWGNPETKSYTILATKGDVTCVLSVGEKLEVLLNLGTAI